MSPESFKRLVALTVGAGALLALAFLYEQHAATWSEIEWLESIPVLQTEE